MLNPPTFIEHNNDSTMKRTSLKCSPLRSSDQFFEKNCNKFCGKRPMHYTSNQMVVEIIFMHMICMLFHVIGLVCDDQILVLRSFGHWVNVPKFHFHAS